MKVKGSIGIARRSDGLFTIHIRDEEASIEFCEVRMTGEQFANAVSGLFGQEVELDFRGLDKIGKTMEHKTVLVEMPAGFDVPHKWSDIPEPVREEMLYAHEAGGWRVETRGSWGNMHRKEGRGYKCLARRWV